MPGRRHETVVEHLTESSNSIRASGFRAELRKLLTDLYQVELDGSFDSFKVIPDAFEIDEDLVVAYEVEDTHRVSDEKMLEYARLWYGLSELEIEVRLVIIDIRGGRMEPELGLWWYGIR